MSLGIGELLIILVICAVPTIAIVVGLGLYAAKASRERAKLAACPLCRASIDRTSTVCRGCGRDLPAGWAAPPAG